LIPPPLIVARFFADEQAHIDTLLAMQEEASRELEEYVEEHAVEEGLLEEAMNDKGKVTKGGVKARLKDIKDESESDEERNALECCLKLIDSESTAGKAVKEAQAMLDAKVLEHYGELSEDEIKTLVVDDKWFTSIRNGIDGEVQQVTQRLSKRVQELEERYANTLPELETAVELHSEKVAEHLYEMGLVFNE